MIYNSLPDGFVEPSVFIHVLFVFWLWNIAFCEIYCGIEHPISDIEIWDAQENSK